MEIPSTVLMAAALSLGSALATMALGKLWDFFLNRATKQTDAINALNLSVTELRVELRLIREVIKNLPEVEKDLHAVAQKVRNLESQV